ncbi:diguanylate cyclase [Azonexus sp. IMCC34839]|uniref:diguanylate cyclase n=1 Tax=Azonexus sp. IMCC34839 TaxID=3133695 RepID=UPI00399C0E10
MVEQTKKATKFESRYLLVLALILLLFAAAGAVAYRGIDQYRETRLDIQELLQVAETIRYSDEVLTMSARMGAMTGNPAWQERYDSFVPQLDAAIDETIRRFPKAKKALEQTSEANERLIAFEKKAFELSRAGRTADASALLLGEEYERDKKYYSEGLTLLTQGIHAYRDEVEARLNKDMLTTEVVVSTLLAIVVFVLVYGFRLISYRLELERTMSEAGRRLLAQDRSKLDEGLRWILKLVASMAHANYCYLLRRIPGERNSDWQTFAQYGDGSEPPALNDTIMSSLFCRQDEDGIVWLPSLDVLSQPHAKAKEKLHELGIGSLLGLQLNHGKEYEFFLALAGCGTPLHWKDSDAPVLRTIAEIIAGAIEVKEKEEELFRLATHDDLTGLSNRRCFTEELERELLRGKRSGQPSAVLMIDLDHFKQVNDTYGHAVGDRVLRHFASQARQALREIDTLARIGGEEFAAILPQADADSALAAAERLRAEIERSILNVEGLSLPITASIGVSLTREEDVGYGSILKRADQALYAAKNAGRNCVRLATEP